VFENRVLRRIFGPKRDEVPGKWRNYITRSSPNIIRVIKWRRMRWNGHVACMGERCIWGFGEKTLRKRDYLEDPGVDGRIMLRWVFRKWDVGVRTGSIWLMIGTGGGHL
jgi:hypothetical protein